MNAFIPSIPKRNGQKNARPMTRVITQNGNNINYMSMATTDFTNNHLMTPEL